MTMTLASTVYLALSLPFAAQLGPTTPNTVNVDPPAHVNTVVATDEDRDRAILMLSGYHGVPTAAELEAAFEDPQGIMLAIAQDDSVSAIHRDRAIGVLAYWPSESVQQFYTQLLESPETPEMVQHRVIGHVAVAFGDQAVDLVASYLNNQDVQFRLTAVQALGTIGTPLAMQQLQTAQTIENSNVVLEQMQQITTGH